MKVMDITEEAPFSNEKTFERVGGNETQKVDVRIIDFVDTGHPGLLRMWDRRQAGYRAMGYRVSSTRPAEQLL